MNSTTQEDIRADYGLRLVEFFERTVANYYFKNRLPVISSVWAPQIACMHSHPGYEQTTCEKGHSGHRLGCGDHAYEDTMFKTGGAVFVKTYSLDIS